MSDQTDKPLIAETQAIWNQNAAYWDSMIGDTGNRFHRTIVEPAALHLLALQPGETVLEIACGNGAFACRMAGFGVHVIATDFSAELLERARERTNHDAIQYALVDATNGAEILALGEQRFQAAVCNMALMDMPSIEPLYAALRRVLKPNGRFVFSVQHPAFNSNGATKTVEMADRNGELETIYAIRVAKYLTPWTERGVGAVGQPTPHYLFHRPLHALLHAGFETGFVLDGLEEPMDEAGPNQGKWWAWSNYREMPPALVACFRLAQ